MKANESERAWTEASGTRPERATHEVPGQCAALEAPGEFGVCASSVGSPRRFKGAWLIAAFLGAISPPAVAAGTTSTVLVVYSNSRLLPANVEADHALRETISNSGDRPLLVFDEFLDVPRFDGEAYVTTLITYLREKYASRPPAVVVAGGEEALDFLLRNRAQLFPDAPIVHIAVSRAFLRSMSPLPVDVVGVPVENDFALTIDLALRWHPTARRLVLVTGTSAQDRDWEARLRDQLVRFQDRATVEFLAGLPTRAVLKRLGELGGDAVVFTPGYFQDGEGRMFTPRESVEAMSAAATAPVYGPFNTFLGHGIVGGYMWTFDGLARQAGEAVNALLGGSAPDALRLPETTSLTLNVDSRQVRRWGIDEKAIPAGAVMHFKTPPFLEEHRKGVTIATVAFLLQTGLLIALLAERRRRRLAVKAWQERGSQLASASRLAMAGELTGGIAHEINQPLGAILANADAAELMLESGAPRRDQLRAILAAIRRDDLRASEVVRRLRQLIGKQEVEQKPFELNEAVSEVESILRSEAQRRRVMLEFRLEAAASTMAGDRVQLQQVVINLVLNAMDAVADMPEGRRTIIVSVENIPGGLALSVRDRGEGIAAAHLPKLFDSFFSTKRTGMGLGLSIARTLVQAHGGRIWAESDVGKGAAFRVEFPASHDTNAHLPGRA